MNGLGSIAPARATADIARCHYPAFADLEKPLTTHLPRLDCLLGSRGE
jgi:hypothetical protein